MAQLLSRFNKKNHAPTLEARTSYIESFLQSFTDELGLLLGNLTINNFSSSTIDSFQGKFITKANNLVEFNNGLKIQWGNVLITPQNSGASITKTIVFDKSFTNTPSILVTPYTSVPQSVFCSYTDRNKQKFKILLCRNDNTTTTVSWLAIGI